MLSKLDKILPKFAYLPIFLALGLNMVIYYLLPIILTDDIKRYDLSLSIDSMLPFVPFFLLFYVLAYIQWGGSYVYHCRESMELCYKMTTADIIAKLICMMFFIFLPTQIVRPEITGNGIFEMGTQFIYNIDKPINLFPSIHCLESWICFRTSMMMKKKNYYYIAFQGIFSLLVCASTVLIKQHFIVDIPAGILAVEIGLFLTKKFSLWRIMDRLQSKIMPKLKSESI